MPAVARACPDTTQGITSPSVSICSTFGATSQSPQRRSEPNHDTTSIDDLQLGISPSRLSSEDEKSVTPEGEFVLIATCSPYSGDRCTADVAREYSPVPGINATPRTMRAMSARASGVPASDGCMTSNVNCGMRLPKRARSRSSSTTYAVPRYAGTLSVPSTATILGSGAWVCVPR